jgi:long-chain acyl-CoA synthetase
VLWTTPVHLKYFLDVAKKRDSHLKTSLKVLFVGGAPLSPIYKKTLQKTFPNAILYEFFGSSETSFISIKTPQDPPLSVGSVCEGVQVSIRDSTHLPMPPETTGMLWVKSPQLFLGYLGDTPLQKHEGFISVGDFGRLSSDGKLYFEGRSSGWITISGNTFNLFRLESALKTILKVEPLVLMVKPHIQKEHQLVVVVSRPIQIDLIQKMRATIRKRFGSHCVPKKIKVCSNWPLLRSGKIDRKALLKQL